MKLFDAYMKRVMASKPPKWAGIALLVLAAVLAYYVSFQLRQFLRPYDSNPSPCASCAE